MIDRMTRRQRLDPLDTDLLATLEERDRRLYAIVSRITRYRNILNEQVKRLRAGEAPEVVRTVMGQRDTLLREIRRLSRDV